jgi:hypothetical protein
VVNLPKKDLRGFLTSTESGPIDQPRVVLSLSGVIPSFPPNFPRVFLPFWINSPPRRSSDRGTPYLYRICVVSVPYLTSMQSRSESLDVAAQKSSLNPYQSTRMQTTEDIWTSLSGISGSISLASWIVVLMPQLIENYRTKSSLPFPLAGN